MDQNYRKLIITNRSIGYYKVRADFERKFKRRRFKFLISFIKFKSFAA